jgi:hypothetical protein
MSNWSKLILYTSGFTGLVFSKVFRNASKKRIASIYPRVKDPQYPLDRRLGGPQSRSGHRGYRKNPLAGAVVAYSTQCLTTDWTTGV